MLQGIQRYPSNYMKTEVPRMVSIAPTPEAKYQVAVAEAENKRYSYKSNPYIGAQAASIARRNARERNRVKQVNDGFNALRKRLPPSVIAALSGGARRGSGTKLSKVDTLRMVVEYIRYLQNLIEESDSALGTRTHASTTDSPVYEDEGVFGGSPYSESVPSPVNSECSSGVSSEKSSNHGYIPNYQMHGQVTAVDEEEFLDTFAWWQQK